ncbi:tRNA (adenosine(37)-N6)-threonylcarbamoyltransferase complex ATPase subunit type 1 TsaE [Croceimicrobium hydrocarbonivorans]|uniref:tRNA threonylcarbamoyladenosine biosynthesis protein TsaE n=1 Tax=Croceimicrobium hydrocarbonivorans TaxID=2761580 RepID=A0A7H0VHX3_9FLAO|nr:tRNA (adenosine(37)-N6)-threonylcarbamoyltransferase complex ATPase subunit type 1 TsaE [Croceimicrobium hydrocarbonivorans]QNR25321.1 tRNA (adenosine(37)-N6)-threonylcarbamoyltransferase complex ATPase subunit type 1 TsaE [Croceimicrobium hydrocarbonivorans]
MVSHTFEIASQAELADLAPQIVVALKDSLVLFKGEMGAGKTTLIKSLCKALGVKDEVSSPTFSLVNEYQGAKGEQIFHFDWYRLEDESEAWDMGWEDYLDRGDYLFMEWPEKISTLIPPDFALIEIEVTSAESRIIRLSHHHE